VFNDPASTTKKVNIMVVFKSPTPLDNAARISRYYKSALTRDEDFFGRIIAGVRIQQNLRSGKKYVNCDSPIGILGSPEEPSA